MNLPLFDFKPMELPEGDLKPIERALLTGIRNLEVALVKIASIWITAIFLIGTFWGVGGYIFANKLDEYSSTLKTTTQMEVELKNMKEVITKLEKRI